MEACRQEMLKKLGEVKELSLIPAKPGINVATADLGLIKLPYPVLVEPEKWPWPGLLLSWVLVSLGAPFWYDVLKNAMGLRSSLAQKDDKDGEKRRAPKPDPVVVAKADQAAG